MFKFEQKVRFLTSIENYIGLKHRTLSPSNMLILTMKKFFILDYDKTIAPPKSPPSESTIDILSTLLKDNRIAILTAGRSISALKELLVNDIVSKDPSLIQNLLLCPKYGNSIFEWEDGWFVLHESPDIKRRERKK